MQHLIAVIPAALLAVWHIAATAAAGPATQARMIGAAEAVVQTAYLGLAVREYSLPGQRGRGGAIVADGEHLVLGTADNAFYRINTTTWKTATKFLPDLATGAAALAGSKRYRLKEISPRVEGLLLHRGTYFVTYTRYEAATDFVHFVLAKAQPGAKAWVTVYESPGLDAPYYTMGCGGRMAVRDDRLYFTVGDFSLDRRNGLPSDVAPQNPRLPWGKVNYIDLKDGSYHPFTLGHRNAQGLTVLRDGTLLAAEHGPQGGDELNVLEDGANYGWPFESFGTIYGTTNEYRSALGPPPPGAKFRQPLYAFVPSPAITQLLQVAGFDDRWYGDLLLASLKAQSLYRIRLSDRRVIVVEPIAVGHRIRDLVQTGGAFYALTDTGSILRIAKTPRGP